MALHVEVIYRSGTSVPSRDSFPTLGEAVSYALRLADNLGQTFTNPAYGPAGSVRIVQDDRLELEVHVFMGGLYQRPDTGPEMIDLA